MADEVQVDALGLTVVYDEEPKTQVNAAGLTVVWSEQPTARVKVDAAGLTVVWTEAPSSSPQAVSPQGISSAEAFGSHALVLDQLLLSTGIPSAEFFGTPLIAPKQLVQPAAVASAEGFGQVAITCSASWDLHLEVSGRGAFQALPFEELQKLGGIELQPLDVQTLPLPLPQAAPPDETPVDKAQRLQGDAALLEEHAVQLLERLRLKAQGLSFPVPPEDTATRAALLALHLSPEAMSFQDYLELLGLQIDLAQQAGQHGPNEVLLHAGGQAETAVSFYESQLKSSISEAAAWAMQAKPLVKTRHTAVVIRDHLEGYQSFPVNNTVLDALGGDASLADIIEDCIPCLERTLSLDGIRPFEQFLDLLQNEIDRRWNYIQGMWSAFNSHHVEICDLLNYLNGLCIPDLFALLAVLSYYWLQLTELLKMNVWGLIWSLIQPLLQSLLCNLNGLLEQFIRLLLAPVECIITSLDHEYAKLYNLGQARWDPQRGLTVNKPYDHSFAKWAHENVTNPVLTGAGPYGMGLLELKRALVNARDFLNGQLKRLQDAIAESLGLDADALSSSHGLFLVMRWLSLVIGLVKAILRFKQDGYDCSPDGFDSFQYRTLVEYLSDAAGTPFVITTTSATDVPTAPPLPSSSPAGQSGLLTELLGNLSTSAVPPAGSSGQEAAPAYHLPDCVARRSELEDARAAVWAAELDHLVP